MTEYFFSYFGAPNIPPYITNESPEGVTVPYDTPATFSLYDDRGYVIPESIQVLIWYSGFMVDEPVVNEYAIIEGVMQSGYTGSITANIYGGYDISIIKEGADGWGDSPVTVEIYAVDDMADDVSGYFQFASALVPRLEQVLPAGRNKVEIEFDRAVKVRPVSLNAEEPADRYTPITWTGNASDAANPANYTFGKVEDGNLTDSGESLDINATWAEENPDHSYTDSGFIVSTHVWVYMDYQMTPKADYNVEIANLVISITPMTTVTEAFIGYVVSQVPRQSLKLVENVPELIMRDDDEGTGDLRKFLNVLQETFDRVVEDVDVYFLELCTVDRIRNEFIDALLWDLGDPFSNLLDLTYSQKRKLAGILVQMYREKGTCEGIVNAARFFLGITLSGCLEPWDETWRLDGGSYGSYTGPDLDELGVTSILAPAEDSYRYSFRIISPTTLTTDQKSKVALIADYVKPAHTFYLGVVEP